MQTVLYLIITNTIINMIIIHKLSIICMTIYFKKSIATKKTGGKLYLNYLFIIINCKLNLFLIFLKILIDLYFLSDMKNVCQR